MEIQIGDGITALHQGKIINGDVVKIRNMMCGSTLQERAIITVKEDATENQVSFYPDECEGIVITPRVGNRSSQTVIQTQGDQP